ncbi:hypothetical protein BDV93DRAFT_444646 [Ceratobasidium sp. AG-I]|nr:hypothetical protein BDV93DRAFT_444646 [Ceratobasidium sp. AG-I]
MKDIAIYLTKLRRAGVAIAHGIAHATVYAFLQSCAPKIFLKPSFKCSDRFVQWLMVALLNWSYRTATQAAQKLPDDWEKKCIDMVMQIAWIIDHFRIPTLLVLNADQTGIFYVTSGSKTWDERGSKQVAVVNKDEKRQFTLMPTITASGKVLPSQAIFKGTSIRTLPSPASRRATEEKGFVYTSGGEKHWSTLDCMKEYILKIVLPYVAAERQRLKLSSSQRIILLLDCWSVHRSKEFLDWMRQNHSFIRIVFVPGGCMCSTTFLRLYAN